MKVAITRSQNKKANKQISGSNTKQMWMDEWMDKYLSIY